MYPIELLDYVLLLNQSPLLEGIGEMVELIPDPGGTGTFIKICWEKPAARQVFPLGDLVSVRRFTSCNRYEPFWMVPTAGNRGGEVPIETQFLLVELEDGSCALLVPLVDERCRASLQGVGQNGLELVVETGDPAVVASEMVGLFVAAGDDPYVLVEKVARSVSAWLKSGRLRCEKELPAFVDQFGWCTWDAFYQDVSQEKVRQGLESFALGGVQPRYLILDDGWQSEQTMPTGERRLTNFAANAKFPGDLAPTVKMAKDEFGIQTFLVWHAIDGYWGGVDGVALPGYHVQSKERAYSPGILSYAERVAHWWGRIVGVVPPEQAYRFFQDYHRHLRLQGVDGVKVDNQASIEGLTAGLGGRVAMMRSYHEALEGSAQTHFLGNLINCMSCSNEMLYSALNSTLTRTSTDFWPTLPESHGLHLYTNAFVSLWFGEFVHPDWDMFQSGHAMGGFHAAGRAVSGGPVYVSDKPDAHNFDLLRKLVLPDGRILRARHVGRPTRDCLFHNPTCEDTLLKVFNLNLDSGVIGVFNVKSGEDMPGIQGCVLPRDVEGLSADRFVVYAHNLREMHLLMADEAWEILLDPLGYEVFTVVPVRDGLAPLGLLEMFNSAGAIMEKGFISARTYQLTVKGSGRCVVWSERAPLTIELDGNPVLNTYESTTQTLELNLPVTPPDHTIRITF